MSQFEMENRDVIRMVNENHRRSNLTYTVGYVLPVEQAERYARFEHRETVRGQSWKAAAGVVLTLLVAAAGILIPLL